MVSSRALLFRDQVVIRMSSPSGSRVRDQGSKAEDAASSLSPANRVQESDTSSSTGSDSEEDEEQVVVFQPPEGRIVNNPKYLMTERYFLRPIPVPYDRVPQSESDVDLEKLLWNRMFANLMVAWRTTGWAEYDKVLGTGGFASVYLGFRFRDRELPHSERQLCAIKRIPCYRQRSYYHPDADTSGFTYKSTKVIWDEVVIMRCLCHANIVRMGGVYLLKPKRESESAVYIVMDYCDAGSLRQEIESQEGGVLSERVARFYFRQILSAVMYMHGKGISHGDIHYDNVMMRYKFDCLTKKCLLTDFGLSSICWSKVSLGEGAEYSQRHNVSGTMSNMPPEQLRKVFLYPGDPDPFTVTGWQSLAADVWNLGILLTRMLTTAPPLVSHAPGSIQQVVGVDDPLTMALLAQMLVQEEGQRATVDQVWSDVWMSKEIREPGLPGEAEMF